MAVSKAQQRATAKYEAKVYDKTLIRVPKGYLSEIKAAADTAGESVNGWIKGAIEARLAAESGR